MPNLRAFLVPLLALCFSPHQLAAQSASEEADTRTRLNTEQAATARQQVEANQTSIRSYEEALAAYAAAVKDYESKVAAQAAESARLEAEYRTALRKWEAAVAACKKGDKRFCAPLPKKS